MGRPRDADPVGEMVGEVAPQQEDDRVTRLTYRLQRSRGEIPRAETKTTPGNSALTAAVGPGKDRFKKRYWPPCSAATRKRRTGWITSART